MTDLEDAKKELGSDFKKYRQTLSVAVQSEDVLLSRINSYIIANEGKELRPVLSLIAGKACGTLVPLSYYCAVVAEMIHNATLMHDDVADDADMRRGVPSINAQFSAAASVLSGDFWLARALHILTTKCGSKILGCFTDAVQKMAEGEMIQMSKAESLDTSEQDYYDIIERKTASLFKATIKSAAYAVKAERVVVEAMTHYAEHLGLAFQMRDDIFDYSPKMKTGKMAGADLKERKITLPLLCAMDNCPDSSERIRKLIGNIENTKIKGTQIKPHEAVIIEEVTKFVYKYDGLKDAQKKLEEQSSLAVNALALIPPSREKNHLIEFAEFVGKRNK
ncbi:MAG: polyprenyl synthetase family protein [Bacteroidales bacterium]|jgi:octaprenyl-diphosphate synthase|nr:polyprenyl synthetase family protein [Bacteroidales bacterium]MCI1732908.1 polyprenyl synthetase family protein [Bacteroidales bacterium]